MKIGINLARITGSFGFYHEANPDENTLISVAEESAKLNIDVLEINVGFAMIYNNWITSRTILGLEEIKKKYNIDYSLHLPFNYLDISSLVEEIRLVSVNKMMELIRIFKPIDPIHYVLHLTNSEANFVANNPRYPEWVIKNSLNQMNNNAKKSVKQLMNEIDNSKKICIENLEPTSYELPFFDVVQDCNTSICYDVGHAIKSNIDMIDFFNEYKSYISHIHLHDIKEKYGEKIDHLGLGEGFLDKEKFINHLEKTNFDGVLLIEVSSFEQAKNSVEYLCGTNLSN